MTTGETLRNVPAFSELPDDQINWFLTHAEEAVLHGGEIFVRQGDSADWMFVLLEGQFQWRGEFGGDAVVLPASGGDVSGVSLFKDEAIHGHGKGNYQWTSPQISVFIVPGACSEDAGIGDKAGGLDVRSDP